MPDKIDFLFSLVNRLRRQRRPQSGQSFVELVLILPILLIILLGVVEVSMYMGRYLDILDLTRQAARFASVRDPFAVTAVDYNCSTPDLFDFFYDTSCIFSPPAGSANCSDPNFCNGMNPYVVIDPARDDVVVSVYTISDNVVTNVWPSATGYWALSDHDADTVHNGNWQTDCQGNVTISSPYYNAGVVESGLTAGSQTSKGYVAVEFYYCYHQALNMPFLSQFVPNPLRIHAYTLMSLPAAQPSPTPKP